MRKSLALAAYVLLVGSLAAVACFHPALGSHPAPLPPVPDPTPVVVVVPVVPVEPAPPPPFPAPHTRAEILLAHESFQGLTLHTSQFGDLPWWPTAWVSLNAEDRAASYPQLHAAGDTDITVSVMWEYGEGGQPYGSGQLVPASNYHQGAALAPEFRASVKDVILHDFVPVIFMAGDFGFPVYMNTMPLVIAALQPQPDDPLDLTPYVKLRMCYDSCIPGWQPPTQVNDAVLATRTACPACVIAMEFSSGYSFWGGNGDGSTRDFLSAAGQALDEIDWEGNSWPPSNWEQYWEILDRWLGPAYHRPPQQTSDPNGAPWLLSAGTPRGPYVVHCLEPFTYQWVRRQVSPAQVLDALATLRALGCPSIDLPQ